MAADHDRGATIRRWWLPVPNQSVDQKLLHLSSPACCAWNLARSSRRDDRLPGKGHQCNLSPSASRDADQDCRSEHRIACTASRRQSSALAGCREDRTGSTLQSRRVYGESPRPARRWASQGRSPALAAIRPAGGRVKQAVQVRHAGCILTPPSLSERAAVEQESSARILSLPSNSHRRSKNRRFRLAHVRCRRAFPLRTGVVAVRWVWISSRLISATLPIRAAHVRDRAERSTGQWILYVCVAIVTHRLSHNFAGGHDASITARASSRRYLRPAPCPHRGGTAGTCRSM